MVSPYVLVVKNVRVRTGPSTSDKSLGYASKDTKFQYISAQTKNNKKWYQILTESGKAFISADPTYTRLVVD